MLHGLGLSSEEVESLASGDLGRLESVYGCICWVKVSSIH